MHPIPGYGNFLTDFLELILINFKKSTKGGKQLRTQVNGKDHFLDDYFEILFQLIHQQFIYYA